MSLCIVVGAGPGLGAAIARRFAKADFQVALVARTADRIASSAQTIGKAGQARGFVADAGNAAALTQALDAACDWGGAPDVLVFNAAVMHETPASALRADGLFKDMAVNLGGAVTCVSALLPKMRERKRGTILFTGGGLALEPYPAWSGLAIGKAALRAYGIALNKEVASDNIHVGVIAICGIIEPGGPFNPDLLAEIYWSSHAAPAGQRQREIVYLPPGADPFYNDPAARYRSISQPIHAVLPSTAS